MLAVAETPYPTRLQGPLGPLPVLKMPTGQAHFDIAMAALSTLGGVMGYVKKGSVPSVGHVVSHKVHVTWLCSNEPSPFLSSGIETCNPWST